MPSRLSGGQMALGVRLLFMGPFVCVVGAIAAAEGDPLLGSVLIGLGVLSFVIAFYRLRQNERAAKSDR